MFTSPMGRLKADIADGYIQFYDTFTSPMGRLKAIEDAKIDFTVKVFTSPMGRLKARQRENYYKIFSLVYIPYG